MMLRFIIGFLFVVVQLQAQTTTWRKDDRPVSGAYVPLAKENVGFADKNGSYLKKDIPFRDDTGKSVLVGDYFKSDKPTILIFAYPTCKLLCHLVLDGVTVGLKQMGEDWTPGKQFQVITVVLTPNENAEVIQNQKAKYIARLGKEEAKKGWHFLIGDEQNILSLAQSVGFKYKWDENTQQYSHAAGIILLDGKGKIANVVQNVRFEGNILKKALIDASEGKIGSVVEQAFLWCYHFDPDANSYTFQAFRFGTILAGIFGAIVVGVLGFLWFTEYKKSKDSKNN